MDRIAFEQAVRRSWEIRRLQADKQLASGKVDAGTRGSVTGGNHLDELTQVFASLFIDAGFSKESVKQSTGIELPGFYRPTKKWDLLIVERGRLVAALEFKSQVGPSFGNNFNNRAEEAIGSATDVWRAYEEGTFGPVRPWLGYVFLLEETPRSIAPVRLSKTVFPVDPVFESTSYKDRYRILCQRLVRERLYDAACFITSSDDPSQGICEPDGELGFANFVASVAGRAAYIKGLDG